MCKSCKKEFTDPYNRRMHAQTISCPEDGPSFSLYTRGGVQVTTNTPILDFAIDLDEGAIGIMKSWGGMHIVSILKEIKRMESEEKLRIDILKDQLKNGVLPKPKVNEEPKHEVNNSMEE